MILLSLFWRRFNFAGAAAGICAGAAVDVLWLLLLPWTGIYELLPGFAAGLAAGIVVSLLTPAPFGEVTALFDRAIAAKDD